MTTNTINPNWNGYDTAVAEAHLMNFGKIYLDEYGCPIDDEYLVEELIREEE